MTVYVPLCGFTQVAESGPCEPCRLTCSILWSIIGFSERPRNNETRGRCDGSCRVCTSELGGTKSRCATGEAATLRQSLSGDAKGRVKHAPSVRRLPGLCPGRGYAGGDPPRPAGTLNAALVPDRG